MLVSWWVFQDTGLSGQRLLDKRWAIPILNKTADFMRKVDGMAKTKEGMNKGGTNQGVCEALSAIRLEADVASSEGKG